jgi:tRNA pseudouridine55 synthase
VSGIINLNKPSGPSSFDMVRLVRRGTRVKRVGHAGTLDPLASGVLLILLGNATRVTEYLMDLPKVYRARVRLGVETTTYDREGDVVARLDVDVNESAVRDCLAVFTGEIEQRPPAFSAIKIAGRPAYERARRGEPVDLRPRTVKIERLALALFDPPRLEIEVECSRGTYIRSLAHDIGSHLGCGAHLEALERARVGPFGIEDSVGVPEVEERLEAETWQEIVMPMDAALETLPAATFNASAESALRNGRSVECDGPKIPASDEESRAYGPDGKIIGIVRYDAEIRAWRPRKIFSPAE